MTAPATPDGLPRNRTTGAFERRVRVALGAMLPAGAPVVVACSGGADSTAALVAVARVRAGLGPVVAAHFDHGLRPAEEAGFDRASVESLARRLGVRFLYGVASGGEGGYARAGSEAASRASRYRWLAQACAEAGAAHCVTGHTLDDQAETVLLRLARGAGTLGAASMAAESGWPVPVQGEALRLLRPLLGVRRSEACAYVVALGIEPRLDPTNEQITFDRNRVRRRVLPELRAVNPRVDEALARFASLARRDEEALEAWAAREAQAIARVTAVEVALGRRALLALPEAVASRVLRMTAAHVDVILDANQIAGLLRIARRRGARLALRGGAASVEGEDLVIRGRPPIQGRDGGGPGRGA